VNLAPRPGGPVQAFLDLLEGSPDPVFVTDRLNQVVAWNPSAERLLGYPASEALGRSCSALLGGCDSAGNRYCSDACPLVGMAGRGEVVRHFELRLRAKDRPAVSVDVNILQLAGPSPGQFYLVHGLKPLNREYHAPLAREEAEGPRPALLTARESPDARARKLTQREVEILGLVAAGRTSAEIATLLHISALTVRNHTQNILDKLEVHSKAEAVAFAFQKHLV